MTVYRGSHSWSQDLLHSLRRRGIHVKACHDCFGEDLRRIAEQVAKYISVHTLKYAFLSTYGETVFFKQETRRWIVLYMFEIISKNKIEDKLKVWPSEIA